MFGKQARSRVMMDSVKVKIRNNLKSYEIGSKYPDLPALPKASILIPLLVKNGEIHVLMTLRSLQLRSNAGEVCFPGGKYDPRDRDEIDTALREAQEEIGLHPDQVEVVSRLFPVINKSGLLVTAVVAFIDDSFDAQPNPAEFPVPGFGIRQGVYDMGTDRLAGDAYCCPSIQKKARV
ncbi:hypothetical protein AAFF_G00104520 [Aldrovandia affinis]|uniref:Nudix hydrolase domain-containing protein n=1 Tax=Aldrovandia affinis TaxID=143900 RepID=A0AAD7T285_9TELE|nr:hypothetical protein AAFF_G00104520 [Aldrovandia affinis]